MKIDKINIYSSDNLPDLLKTFGKKYIELYKKFNIDYIGEDLEFDNCIDKEASFCIDAIEKCFSTNKLYKKYICCKNSCISRFLNKIKIQLPKCVKDFFKRKKYRKSCNENVYRKIQDLENMYERAFEGRFTEQDSTIKKQEEIIRSLNSRVKQLESQFKMYDSKNCIFTADGKMMYEKPHVEVLN